MAIFRDFKGSHGNSRSSEDVRRHRELVEDSIKKNIGDIVANESIIGQNKDKKVKVPIKGLKEYKFVYGSNNGGVGSGTGNEDRGDVIPGEEKKKGKGKGDKAGNDEGEDIFEVEITIEELIKYLLEDLELPDIDKKKLADIEKMDRKRLGHKKKGIAPHLDMKKSMMEKIKAKQAKKRALIDEGEDVPEDFNIPWDEDYLKYHRTVERPKDDFNAVIFCIMDVSGSMDNAKKYLARSFYFLLYQFLRLKYDQVEVVFVAHTTVGKEVNENDFFHKGESGGTYISSGYTTALDIIEKRYNPSKWNIYAFHCSDGDNWSEDNEKAIEAANKLCDVCNLFGYGEILAHQYGGYSGTMKDEFKKVKRDNFARVSMDKKEDVVPALKKLLEKEGD